MKIEVTTTKIGFAEERKSVDLISGSLDEITGVLGVCSWNKIPDGIREDGRGDVGKLYDDIDVSDFVDPGDRKAALACIREAKRLTFKKVDEIEINVV